MNTPEGVLIDAEARFRVEEDRVVRKMTQELPDHFLRSLQEKRDASRNAPMGNFHHVASIPVALAEKWKLEGFDIFDKNVAIPEVLKRLHREDMQALIATSKTV